MGNTSGSIRQPSLTLIPDGKAIEIARKKNRLISVLLLGAGESGKSTILKQMRIINGGGFTGDERDSMKRGILLSLIETTAKVLQEMRARETNVAEKNETSADIVVNRYADWKNNATVTQELADAIVVLLSDDNFRTVSQDKSLTFTQDSFLELIANFTKFPEWGGIGWEPSDADILLNRVRTVGMTNTFFKMGQDVIYNMIDVGGQKSERKKFMKVFKDIDQVIFVSSLSEYDQNLFEDNQTNRLEDSLVFFESVCATATFDKSAKLLFLNKLDLLKKKYYYEGIPLKTIPGFEAPPKKEDEVDDNCALAQKWFQKLFISKSGGQITDKNVLFTTATDSEAMNTVIMNVTAHITKTTLLKMGMVI